VKFVKEFFNPKKLAQNTFQILKEGQSDLSKRVGDMVHEDLTEITMPGEQKTIILKALKSKPDCLSLRGVITFDGHEPKIFEHSIKYSEYRTTANVITYERYPNHLNVIKSSIAKQFTFPEINFGEDTDWATQINKSGLLKKEVYIEEIIYYYKYVSNK
jgi:hypothetical protein